MTIIDDPISALTGLPGCCGTDKGTFVTHNHYPCTQSLQRNISEKWMERGLNTLPLATVFIRGEVEEKLYCNVLKPFKRFQKSDRNFFSVIDLTTS